MRRIQAARGPHDPVSCRLHGRILRRARRYRLGAGGRPARQAGARGRQGVVPLAKRALTANKAKVATNALKLNGQTATQIAATPGPATDAATLNGQTAAQIAATPGPTSSLSPGLFNYRTQSFSVDAQGAAARDTAVCLSGEKAIGGGWSIDSGLATATVDRPMPDGSGWRFAIFAESGNDVPAQGTIYAVCAKVS